FGFSCRKRAEKNYSIKEVISMNQRVDRRDFLKTSSQAAGGLAAVAMFGHSRNTLAANDTVGVAIVGTRGRGKEHILGFHRQPGVKRVALCDVDDGVLHARASQCEKLSGQSPTCYRNMREVFAHKEVDAGRF